MWHANSNRYGVQMATRVACGGERMWQGGTNKKKVEERAGGEKNVSKAITAMKEV
jgi:hypothetical protein